MGQRIINAIKDIIVYLPAFVALFSSFIDGLLVYHDRFHCLIFHVPKVLTETF